MGYQILEIDGVEIQPTKRFPVEIFPEAHNLNDTLIHLGKLDASQLPDDVMLDSEHQSDPHTMIIDGRDVSSDGSKLDTIETGAEVNNLSDQQAQSLTSGSHSSWHHHDDWYYRKTQISTAGGSSVHWDNLTNKPDFSTNHNHDDRYYTETEINGILIDYYTKTEADSLLDGKSDTGHSHDDRYYTETEINALIANYYTSVELDSGQLDNRYHTQTEVSALLANKSNVGHTHDDRYYTETEINTNHYNKVETDSLIAAASYGISGSVATYADLPLAEDVGSIYIVRQTVSTDEEGFYRWTGSGWEFLANNTGTTEHNNLIGLNTGDYLHLTALQYAGLTGGSNTSLHLHDDRYYTETETNLMFEDYFNKVELNSGVLDSRYYTEAEIDNLIANYYTKTETDLLLNDKANVIHNHDTRYYTQSQINNTFFTKTQLNNGQLDSRYYTETEINTFLSNKSDIGHEHDDRYYTELEIDSFLSYKSDVSHTHDTLYYRIADVDALLATKSDTSHTHDNRYFTETEISSTTDGSSGADKVGATQLSGYSGTTVQSILEELGSAVQGATGNLDEAYDDGGSGSGREIFADSGPVKINPTSTNAPLDITSQSQAPTTALSGGQISVIDNVLYIYDGSRSSWLSPSKFITFGLNNNCDGKLLAGPGSMRDWNSGFKLAKNGAIVGVSLQSSNLAENKKIQIILNGTAAHDLYTDSYGNIVDNSLNIQFNERDRLQIYVSSQGSSLFDVMCNLEIAWRP